MPERHASADDAIFGKNLKIFFLTRHISFREIPDAITKAGILEALPLCDLYLRQLGTETPTIAVAGLNHTAANRVCSDERKSRS